MPDPHRHAVLAALDADATHRDVETLLRDAGWSPCGAGDWAVALASPGNDIVARISPFDPIGPYTAQLYAEAAPTGLVPRLLRHERLAGGGDLQLMERLIPVPEPVATDFLDRLAGGAAALAELARVVRRVHEDALRDLPWCGPLDTNPSNVMRAPDGRLVLIDPYYADGPNLYEMAESDPDRFVTTIPEDQRRFLTEIPLAWSGPWETTEREALCARLERADLRRR